MAPPPEIATAAGWHTPVDGYCERVSDGFWAEPLNALTNAAFLIAAVVAFVWTRRAERCDLGRRDLGLELLVGITAVIGLGSFLFHTLATRWAAIADIVPILLFIVVYLGLIARRCFGLAWPWAIAIGLAYVPASIGFRLVWREITGGGWGATGGYLPALAALAISAGLLARRRHPAAGPLGLAAALFALSLIFRSLDLPLCGTVPTGMHFLWHLANAVLLAYLMRTMLCYGEPLER